MKNKILSTFKYIGLQILMHMFYVLAGFLMYVGYVNRHIERPKIAQAAMVRAAGIVEEMKSLDCGPGAYFKYDALRAEYEKEARIVSRGLASLAGTIFVYAIIFFLALVFSGVLIYHLMRKGVIDENEERYNYNLTFLILAVFYKTLEEAKLELMN